MRRGMPNHWPTVANRQTRASPVEQQPGVIEGLAGRSPDWVKVSEYRSLCARRRGALAFGSCREGDRITGDVGVDDAFDGVRAFYDFFGSVPPRLAG